MKTNWEDLSRKLGVLKADGSELYTGQSMQAIETILGDEWIEDTIDCFIEGRKGNDLAIKTIRRIQSNKAAQYAYKVILKNKETNTQKASLALWAMSDIRMPICMKYAEENIGDKNYEAPVLSIIRNLIFDSCLAFEQTRLHEILNKFDSSYKEDLTTLKSFVNQEFKRYENGN